MILKADYLCRKKKMPTFAVANRKKRFVEKAHFVLYSALGELGHFTVKEIMQE